MVRKRSRTSRKHYESEDDNDSDLDFDLDSVSSEPVQKKYSLRQRKRPLFTDFECDDDDDDPPQRKKVSDDEDFEPEKELELMEASKSQSTVEIQNYEPTGPETSYFEPQAQSDELDGMIDFEDMIRADIVINKCRIDYDNAISTSEIKLADQEEHKHQGRPLKPKKPYDDEIDSSILEPETEVQEGEEDEGIKDYDPADDLLIPEQCLETDIEETDTKNLISANGNSKTRQFDSVNQTFNGTKYLEDESSQDSSSSHSEATENHALCDPLAVDELKVEDYNQSNGHIIGESAVIEVKSFLPQFTVEDTDDDDDDDDDVVIIETKHEVIVLDD